MTDSNTVPAEAIPWYKSRIILGVALSLICNVLVISGLTGEVTADTQQQLLDVVITLVGGAGDLYAIMQRITQKTAPVITSTAAKAEEKHAEITAAKADPQAEVPSWMR